MKRVALFVFAASAFAIACDRTPTPRPHDDEPTRRPDTPASIYASRCEACHGKTGRGDGPTAATLTPRPPSFADPVWQSQTSDAQIQAAISGGGPAVGKSALMPSNPDLAKDEAMTKGLVAIVRGFGSH